MKSSAAVTLSVSSEHNPELATNDQFRSAVMAEWGKIGFESDVIVRLPEQFSRAFDEDLIKPASANGSVSRSILPMIAAVLGLGRSKPSPEGIVIPRLNRRAAVGSGLILGLFGFVSSPTRGKAQSAGDCVACYTTGGCSYHCQNPGDPATCRYYKVYRYRLYFYYCSTSPCNGNAVYLSTYGC